MSLVFWANAGLLIYTYLLYPVFLLWFSRSAAKPVLKNVNEPGVSVILSAFNEERFIEEKILNLLSLDYPADKIEILVGSDGASDATDRIVSKFPNTRVRFFRFVRNLGKPHVLNGLVREANFPILLFTDARQRLETPAVRRLVENFADPSVGCVTGELFFETVRGSGVAAGMDAYWRYEKALRRMESLSGSMLGATGAIYAVRRRLFTPLPVEILVDDMYIPFMIIRKGYRAVVEPGARAYDLVSSRGAEEFRRKVRTLAGNFQIFVRFPDLFHPLKSPVAWQLVSHKLLRLLVPFFLGGIFISNLFLAAGDFYAWTLILQLGFYGLALAGYLNETMRRNPERLGLAAIPYTFCVLNFAAAAALYRFALGRTKAAWEKAYDR